MKWKLFESYVRELMAQEQIPGVAVALSQNGKVIYEHGFGVKDLETKAPITPETIFGIASISKSFTALAIMKLVEDGKLQLNDAVKDHLPNFTLSNYNEINDIKIHHLLSHTTGIATVKRNEKLLSFEEHLDYLSELTYEKLGMPGEHFCYNNDMFLLLGAIIEKVTEQKYKDYIKQEIFTPMDMTRTSFDLNELTQLGNISTPYVLENNKPTACAWPTLGNYAVGGGIRSTVTDLLKYGRIYIDESNLFTHKMAIGIRRTNGNSSYGYAFQTTPDYGGVTLVEHGGGQPGVSSNFGFIREKGIVAVVLTNIGKVSADAIWLAAVNTVLGLPIKQKRFTEPTFQMNKEQLPKFIGTYETGEGSSVKISFANEKLTATLEGKVYPLRASGEETLVMTPIERPMRFYFNENKESWALFLGLRMFVKVNQ